MIYDYITDNFREGEPIFFNELPGKSRDYLRQEMKKLVDDGKLERLYNGVYFLPYITSDGKKGKISFDQFIKKKYLSNNGKSIGYITGVSLIKEYKLSIVDSSYYEVCSNEASTKQRKKQIDGNMLVVYKPVVEISNKNKEALQFLDLMTIIDKYCDLSDKSIRNKVKNISLLSQVDFKIVKKYLSLYPDRVYRNLYELGFMIELI